MNPTGLSRSSAPERFRDLLAVRMGLWFDDDKLPWVGDILRRRAELRGLSEEDYLRDLDRSGGFREESAALAVEITVPETYFFRNREQFDAFRVIAAQTESRPLRILSAPCATGEEPYSLAILLTDWFPYRAFPPDILGVDLNPSGIDKARRGVYSPWALRETPAAVWERWFQPAKKGFAVSEHIRAMVRWDIQNLADPDASLWGTGPYDVIFCRNLMMYFTPDHARSLVSRLAALLAPEGHLFVGHAETLRGLSQEFILCHTHGAFYYRLKPPGLSGPPSAPPPVAALGEPKSSPSWSGVVDDSASWVENIQRASDRIRNLAENRSPGTPETAAPTGNFDRALDYFRTERFGEAWNLVREMPSPQGRNLEVLLLRAVLCAHRGDLDQAEQACGALLGMDDLNAGAHYLLALCREGRGDLEGSAEHDKSAAYLDTAFAMPRLHLGLLAKKRGDLAVAAREFERALTLFQGEDASRILFFGGGFSREALLNLCRAELSACGGAV